MLLLSVEHSPYFGNMLEETDDIKLDYHSGV